MLKIFPDLVETLKLANERENILETLTHTDEEMSEVCFDEMSEHKLYLGNQKDSEQYDKLYEMNIKTVISLLSKERDESVRSNYQKLNITHHHYEIEDQPHSNLVCILDLVTSQINEGLRKGNVLIHCYAGISRSASCVLYFLLQNKKFDRLFDAYEYLIKCRNVILPNIGFFIQIYLHFNSIKDVRCKNILDLYFGVQYK